ncbi:MAG TPA: phosphatase PAP2 family protein [Thermoanaerobaculia bacterium]|nr:phosphatase PAP2 family protein [Thermoanaerobaculia bacterium]
MTAIRLHAHAAFERLLLLDMALCLLCHHGVRRPLRRGFAVVSRLGDGWWWLAVGAIVLGLEGPAAWPTLGRMAAVPLLGLPAYKLLKRRTARPRPCAAGHGVEAVVPALDLYSFPSGHTLHAVGFTVVLAASLPELLWLAAPFTALVALSRVVLVLHYPTDVVAGAGLGGGLGVLVSSL